MRRRDTRARITVETSSRQKGALDALLGQSGLTLPEWFDLRIEEEAAPYQIPLLDEDIELKHPLDISDVGGVRSTLQGIDWDFRDASTSYFSHDLHPYPAKFIPQIPRYLISLLSRRGELVWDPFGGSGTTALEATLLGRRCLSTDVNPIAKVIGEAKTQTLTGEQDRLLLEFADEIRLLSSADGLGDVLRSTKNRWQHLVPPIPNLESWFHSRAIEELAYLRWRISELGSQTSLSLALAAFSRSILRASFQDSETRYVSKYREISRGEVLQIYAMHLQAALKKVRALGPLLHFRKPSFETADLRIRPLQLDAALPNAVDLIVASPPYPNATDYHLYHRFRLFWLGFDPRSLATKEIGSHLRHQKEKQGFEQYRYEISLCLMNMLDVLRPGRFVAMVIGDSVFEKVIHHTAAEVRSEALKIGFEHVVTTNRKVHSTKRSFSAAGRRLGAEQILVLRKPTASLRLIVQGPSYKPWPYEEQLRRHEIAAITQSPVSEGSNGNLIVNLPAEHAYSLRSLTFSSRYSAPGFNEEPTWQAVLENGNGRSRGSRKDPKYVTHGIHAYKGKFYPQLAKTLFNLAGAAAGSKILDPFCGSGTVLLEAYLNGLDATGIDTNPLAVKIARAKVDILSVDPYKRDRLLAKFEERLANLGHDLSFLDRLDEKHVKELESWFPPPVLLKLGAVLGQVEQVGDHAVRQLLEVLVSSIVRDISHQEPKDLRIRRRKWPLQDAPVGDLLARRVRDVRERLRHFAEICNWAPARFIHPKVHAADSRLPASMAKAAVAPHSVELIVTSPPYATALPYIDTDRLSLLLLLRLASSERREIEATMVGNREIRPSKRAELDKAIEREDFESIRSPTARSIVRSIFRGNKTSDVGFRRRNMAALVYSYFSDMSLVIANATRVLKTGGNAFIVVGDNRTIAGKKEVVIRSSRALREIGESVGWQVISTLPITVTQEDRLHNKNSITENEIIWFRAQT